MAQGTKQGDTGNVMPVHHRAGTHANEPPGDIFDKTAMQTLHRAEAGFETLILEM